MQIIFSNQKIYLKSGIYCILPDKTQFTYECILRILIDEAENLGHPFQPKEILVDYEIAMLNALNSCLNTSVTEIRGCYFHFTQCVIRNIATLRLRPLYDSINSQFKVSARKIMTLAFLKEQMIVNEFEKIKNNELIPSYVDKNSIYKADIIKFIDYLESTWIKDEATFKRKLWNQYKKKTRTKNTAEGKNRAINAKLPKSHTNIHGLIELFRNDELKNRTDYEHFLKTNKIDKEKSGKYQDLQTKIDKYYDLLEKSEGHPDKIDPQRFLHLIQYLLIDNSTHHF